MTATDDLRSMLDERSVEHYDGTEGTYWGGSVLARNGLHTVYRFSARGVVGGLDVHLLRVTPEQAIEATLGSDLKAENAKLRELVCAAWRCIHTGPSCYDCCLIAGGCTLQSAMRELGVEL